jgi:hypothetical protein
MRKREGGKTECHKTGSRYSENRENGNQVNRETGFPEKHESTF